MVPDWEKFSQGAQFFWNLGMVWFAFDNISFIWEVLIKNLMELLKRGQRVAIPVSCYGESSHNEDVCE